MPELTIRSPARAERLATVEGDVFRIGRDAGNDLQLDDPRSGRHHAELVAQRVPHPFADQLGVMASSAESASSLRATRSASGTRC